MKNTNTSKTVFVALSGGVDSAVSALRLQREGYEVVGVFIRVWHPDFLTCNWEAERLDAMRVAAHLGIPFLTCDAREAYKRGVADVFIEAYTNGSTPNPDVLCNSEVKFGVFADFAFQYGADYIATGHHARVVHNAQSSHLYRGKDNGKDQSYFLWRVSSNVLRKTLFPVGDSIKDDVRHEATHARIPVAQKRDSQGICFLGHVDIPGFLSHYTELSEGAVLDTDGNRIGTHRGALVYTLGQRHGFTISKHTNSRLPHYVVDKDIVRNTITVNTTPPTLENEGSVLLRSCNWFNSPPEIGGSYVAQFRYRQTPVPVTITSATTTTYEITVSKRADMPADGQSCVLYCDDECLGGGIIATNGRDSES